MDLLVKITGKNFSPVSPISFRDDSNQRIPTMGIRYLEMLSEIKNIEASSENGGSSFSLSTTWKTDRDRDDV